jgi:hypothetical protein
MLQIAVDYPGLPDLKQMTIDEIRFFYKPLIKGLIEQQIQEERNRDGSR